MEEDSKQLETVLMSVVEHLNDLQDQVAGLEGQIRKFEEDQASVMQSSTHHLTLLEDLTRKLAPHALNLKQMSEVWSADVSDQKGMIVKFRQHLDELEKRNRTLGEITVKANKQLDGLKVRWIVIPMLVVLAGAALWIKVHEPEERSAESIELEKAGRYYRRQINMLEEDEIERLYERLNKPEETRELVFAPEPKTTRSVRSRKKKSGRKKK